jgi:rhodanese-related sulfurtransferase
MFAHVTPQQAQELIANGRVEVVDVREPGEWAQGHIPGARLLTLEQLRAAPRKSLPADGVLFVCAGGLRSQTAARLAAQHGVTHVHSLTGGTRAWLKAGFPLATELGIAV